LFFPLFLSQTPHGERVVAKEVIMPPPCSLLQLSIHHKKRTERVVCGLFVQQTEREVNNWCLLNDFLLNLFTLVSLVVGFSLSSPRNLNRMWLSQCTSNWRGRAGWRRKGEETQGIPERRKKTVFPLHSWQLHPKLAERRQHGIVVPAVNLRRWTEQQRGEKRKEEKTLSPFSALSTLSTAVKARDEIAACTMTSVYERERNTTIYRVWCFPPQTRSVPFKVVLPKVEQLLVVGRADEEVAVLEVERSVLLGRNAGAESAGLGVDGSLETGWSKLALAAIGRVTDLAGDVPLP
jgi:hypothetical protein